MGSQCSVRATAFVSIVHDDLQFADLPLLKLDLTSSLLGISLDQGEKDKVLQEPSPVDLVGQDLFDRDDEEPQDEGLPP